MWSLFYKLITALLPPDASDEQVQRAWRNSVGWTMMALAVFALFTGLAMSVGIPGFVGQLVWADDVIVKVQETTKPAVSQMTELSKKVDVIEKKLDANTASTNQFLAQAKAAEIRQQKLKRCTATTAAERDSLNREIDRLQFEYRLLQGERYDAPACAEL